MALVPHKDDADGQKAFKEKIAKAQKSGTAADKAQLLEEHNIHVDGKPKIEPATKA